jgi:outer membrane protein OmpA-like peptidoglycan-associated protein
MLAADAADIPGSKDPLGLKRYDATRITYYDEKAFEAYTLPLGKMTKPIANGSKGAFEKTLELEGKVTRVSYVSTDANRTALEVARNYKTELADKGWEILWEGSEGALSLGGGRLVGGQYIAAKKGSTHLSLYIVNYTTGNTPPGLKATKGAPIIALDVIESAAMEEKMVVVKAEEMASALIDQGGVNLYGFYFDTGSATLKGESGPTLDEVEKLLKADASLRLLVVGHTDVVGGFDDNIDLSKKRAAAVVAALSERVPAAASRLTPCGVGYQCPIASNSSDEGRAKNRRVALVRVEK